MIDANRAHAMRVLVTWGSERGGTEGIARIVAEELVRRGLDVTAAPAHEARVRALDGSAFDAVVVGGALYANRWHRRALGFVARNVRELRRVPLWLFSSGPLDASADGEAVEPTRDVAALMDRTGAIAHVTFGGRLAPDAKGFPASAMAKEHAGDWRNPERVRAWAGRIADALPDARPRPAVEPPARSWSRLAEHALAAWAACAAIMGVSLRIAPTSVALALHAVAAPLVYAAIAVHYFRPRGAREPLPTAFAFVAIALALDAGIVSALVLDSFAMFASPLGSWLPLGLVFLVTWVVGLVMSTLPWAKPESHGPPASSPGGAHA